MRLGTVSLMVLLCTSGCDPGVGKRLEYGVPRANFRFEVSLEEPIRPSDLFAIGHRLAQQNGFNVDLAEHVVSERLDNATGRKSLQFANSSTNDRSRPRPVSGQGLYKISFTWEPDQSGLVNSFWFIFQLDGMGEFVEQEWFQFKSWRDEVLPNALDIDAMIVGTHPAEFTSVDNLQAFSEASGVAIPERYR